MRSTGRPTYSMFRAGSLIDGRIDRGPRHYHAKGKKRVSRWGWFFPAITFVPSTLRRWFGF